MFKNNISNFLILDDYKNEQKEEYTNIAKQNEENFKTKKFEKFKPKDSTINDTNLLKEEENKLKKMIFSILKNKENQTKNEGKSTNNYKNNKLSNTNITFSNQNENQIKKLFNKNYKQFKKNAKNKKKNKCQKIKKSTSEIKLYNNFIPKNIYPSLCIVPKKDIKKTFSFKNTKLLKRSQNINSSISNITKSRNNYNSFDNSGRDYISEGNQSSIKCLNLSSKNSIEKMSDRLPVFTNKKEGKNYPDVNKSKVGKLKNVYTFNRNSEEKNKNNTRSFSLKYQKNFITNSFDTIPRKKSNSVPIFTKNISNVKNLINFFKSDANIKINKLKINNLKIFRINKEKIRKNLIIRPDNQKNDPKKWESSCISNHRDRPKISDSFILLPLTLCSQRDSTKNSKNILSKIYENEDLNKKKSYIKKSTKVTIFHEKFRKLIHKGLIYDSLDDEELEFEETISNNFYIDPNSLFCFIFDLIIFCLTVYTSISIPYYLARNLKVCKEIFFSFFHFFNCLSEIFNVIDTVLGFFRAYYSYDEQLIKKSRLMIIHYTKSWFLIDLIASIPFYSIFNSYEPECSTTEKIYNKYYSNEIHNLHYLFICIKMIKLWKVFKNNYGFKRICRILKHHLFFKEKGALITKIYTIFLIFHFGSCVHIFIARNSYPNWILNIKMETHGFLEIYISSIYCLTMTITTVGYGDITCYSFNERIFQIILLMFGIMGYSWILTSISNYAKKYNNNLNDFKQKVDILKNIKLHHPNMPNQLYTKIMQYLKYRYHNEKQNRNIIFDCLPLCLKNKLIYEMYKPIITKFIFFKNIDNIDFIVKVILAFRPVIAIKNDIMVNDGDMVEEIIFVKKGVLTVQLLVNLENYKENVEKYRTINLFNLKKKSSLEETLNLSNIILNNNSINESLNNYEKKNLLKNNSTIDTSFKNKTYENKNRKYIKIINIRKNEHFGDVLMFSGERSPMRVMVRSSKAELFLLKKEDVVKIAFAYSNIWRRINEKSVYNFEQMKKSIQKIMEVLSPQTLKTTTFYNNNENNDLPINKKIEYKKDNINYIEKNNNFSKLKNNKENDQKNFLEKTNYNSGFSSSKFTDSVENSEINKEKEDEKKDMRKRENINEPNIKESSFILSMKYPNINSDKKKFYSERNKKIKTKEKNFKITKNQSLDKLNNKKHHYSIKSLNNKKNHNFILKNNTTKNNNIHIIINHSNMCTPYREEEVNQEIYVGENFELNNVDENGDNLLSKRKFSIKNKNNIIDTNSKQKTINNYVVEKLNDICIINKINNEHKNNNTISKGYYFSIKSSYENFNSLSKNNLINNKNLQKKMRVYLRKQIRTKFSHSIIKIKNINLDKNIKRELSAQHKNNSLYFNKINDENLVNSENRKPVNSRNSTKTSKNISFDSKNRNNKTFTINEISLSKYNNLKNKISLNLPYGNLIQKTPNKSNSHVSLKRVNINRNLSVDSSFHPLYKKKINITKKLNKTIDKINSKYHKSNNNLLSLISNNILNSTENLIEPDKFYRRYFNMLINNNNHSNNQNKNIKKKYHSLKPRKELKNIEEERKNLFPEIKSKMNKTYCSKKNI